MIGRRRWLVALAGGAVAVASLAPSMAPAAPSQQHATGTVRAWHSAQQKPDQKIDAKTQPQQAGDALDECANAKIVAGTSPPPSGCSWDTTSKNPTFVVGYGPPQILGDALYNCADESNSQAYSESSVTFSDEREESTSISETLSVEVSLGFLGFEKATAEFELFSKQSTSFSTSVTTTNAVAVPPGWKGWTETQLATASVTGDAYITSGIKLIQVQNIDLSFPGYQDPTSTADSNIKIIGYREEMTSDDRDTRCADGPGAQALAPGGLDVTLCRATCAARKVVGITPPRIRRGTAVMTRRGRTYAKGTHIRGHHRLKVRRAIRPGKYTLTVIERRRPPRQDRGRVRRELRTIVPITVR